VLEGQIAQYIQRHLFTVDRLIDAVRHKHPGPGQLGTRLRSGNGQALTGRRVMRAVIKTSGRLDFPGAQAVRSVRRRCLALHGCRIKTASPGVADQAIDLTVQRIALLQHSLVQDRQARGDKNRLALLILIGVGLPGVIDPVLHQKIQCRRPGDDAVEVVGVALGFDQGFAPAIGAAGEIGVRRLLAVIGANQLLGGQCRQVDAAMGEVRAFLCIVAPAIIHALVAHIGSCQHKAAAVQWRTAFSRAHLQRNPPAQAAATHLQITLGPGVSRQLDFETDTRCQRTLHFTGGNAIAGDFAGRQHLAALAADSLQIDPGQRRATDGGFDHWQRRYRRFGLGQCGQLQEQHCGAE